MKLSLNDEDQVFLKEVKSCPVQDASPCRHKLIIHVPADRSPVHEERIGEKPKVEAVGEKRDMMMYSDCLRGNTLKALKRDTRLYSSSDLVIEGYSGERGSCVSRKG